MTRPDNLKDERELKSSGPSLDGVPFDLAHMIVIEVDILRDARVPVEQYDLEQARREITLLRAHRRALSRALRVEIHMDETNREAP